MLWDVEARQPIGSPLPDLKSWVATRFTDGDRLFAVDPELWLQRACALVAGGLTPEQWERVVPEQDYRPVCPSG